MENIDKEHYVVIGYNSSSIMPEMVEVIGLYSNLNKAEECVKTENNACYYEMKIIKIKKVDSRIKKNNSFGLGFRYDVGQRINGLIDGEESDSEPEYNWTLIVLHEGLKPLVHHQYGHDGHDAREEKRGHDSLEELKKDAISECDHEDYRRCEEEAQENCTFCKKILSYEGKTSWSSLYISICGKE